MHTGAHVPDRLDADLDHGSQRRQGGVEVGQPSGDALEESALSSSVPLLLIETLGMPSLPVVATQMLWGSVSRSLSSRGIFAMVAALCRPHGQMSPHWYP